MTVDALARYYNISFSPKKSLYLLAEIIPGLPKSLKKLSAYTSAVQQTERQKIILLKPLTYMNLSGQAVRKALSYYRLNTENLLVVQDDKDLPFLTMKFQKNRGSAGHNGIKSIHEELKTENYTRWRIGIQGYDVLKPFDKSTQEKLSHFLSQVPEVFHYFLQQGLEKTAQKYHTKTPSQKES